MLITVGGSVMVVDAGFDAAAGVGVGGIMTVG